MPVGQCSIMTFTSPLAQGKKPSPFAFVFDQWKILWSITWRKGENVNFSLGCVANSLDAFLQFLKEIYMHVCLCNYILPENSFTNPSQLVWCHLCLLCYLINAISHQHPIQFDLQLNEMLEEKVRPYIQNISNGALPRPILIQSQKQDKKVSTLLSLSLWLYL